MNLQPVPSDSQVRLWAMAMHLSQLANCIVPAAGIIIPIVIWQVKKNEMPELDVHGKIIANWLISALIYSVMSVLLLFALVGFILLPVLAVLAIIFPIIGGVKANNGEVWKYPLTITFFR
jgi:uncharacterized Tic20 family protein